MSEQNATPPPVEPGFAGIDTKTHRKSQRKRKVALSPLAILGLVSALLLAGVLAGIVFRESTRPKTFFEQLAAAKDAGTVEPASLNIQLNKAFWTEGANYNGMRLVVVAYVTNNSDQIITNLSGQVHHADPDREVPYRYSVCSAEVPEGIEPQETKAVRFSVSWERMFQYGKRLEPGKVIRLVIDRASTMDSYFDCDLKAIASYQAQSKPVPDPVIKGLGLLGTSEPPASKNRAEGSLPANVQALGLSPQELSSVLETHNLTIRQLQERIENEAYEIVFSENGAELNWISDEDFERLRAEATSGRK